MPRRWAGYGPTVTSPPVYSIGAVARMLDIPPATLRTWEERYGLPTPERSPGGHRLYSRDQTEDAIEVKPRRGARLGDGQLQEYERLGSAPVAASSLLGGSSQAASSLDGIYQDVGLSGWYSQTSKKWSSSIPLSSSARATNWAVVTAGGMLSIAFAVAQDPEENTVADLLAQGLQGHGPPVVDRPVEQQDR